MISVVVPVYNGEKFIEQCKQMFLNQTFSDFEVVFINDGSKDSTEEKLKKLSEDDNRFHYYSKPNEGVSVARNYGVSKSTGDYILFVDVDDYIFPNHLENLYDNLVDNNADISVGNYYKLLVSEKIPSFEANEEILTYTGKEAAEAMLYRKGLNGYPVLKLIKKELALQVPFVQGVAYGEDGIFVYNLYLLAKKVVCTNKVTYIYYQQPSSANHNMRYNQIEPSWKAAYEHFLLSEKTKSNNLENAARAKLYVFASDFLCRLKRNSEYDGIRNELIMFIKNNSKLVFRDKKCKKINRYMAFVGMISPNLLVFCSKSFIRIKGLLHIEMRHSL